MKTDCNVECSVLTWEWLAFFIRSLWSVDVTCDIIACQQTKRVQIVKNIYSCGFTSCRSSTFTILSCIKSVSLWYCQQITRCSIAFITNLKLKCELHSNSKSFRTCCFYKDYMCYFKSIKLGDGAIFFYCDGCQMMVTLNVCTVQVCAYDFTREFNAGHKTCDLLKVNCIHCVYVVQFKYYYI